MLKRFEVKNFMNFIERVSIDFSKVGGYQFSTNCITDGMISKMIIYGRNATGKTNLGRALFDIKDILPVNSFLLINDNYLNADSKEQYADFKYLAKILNIEDFDEIVVGGFHCFDCVEKFSNEVYKINENVLVDSDLTEMFWGTIQFQENFRFNEFNPNEKLLKPFFLKKKINREDLTKYATTSEELDRLNKFYDITKGLVKFSKVKDVKELFAKIEQ